MHKIFIAMLTNDDGATMVEYGLVLSLIACVAYAAVAKIGKTASATFTSANTDI